MITGKILLQRWEEPNGEYIVQTTEHVVGENVSETLLRLIRYRTGIFPERRYFCVGQDDFQQHREEILSLLQGKQLGEREEAALKALGVQAL